MTILQRRLDELALIVWIAAALGAGTTACGNSITEGDSDRHSAREGTADRGGPTDFLLVPDGSKTQTTSLQGSIELGVRLYEKRTSDPVGEGEIISFEITRGRGTIGRLSSTRTETDSRGRASVSFRAQGSTGRAEVRVDHSGADPLTMTIRTERFERGTLAVELIHTNGVDVSLSDIDVHLYESSNRDCEDFDPLQRPRPDPLDRQTQSRPGTTAMFESKRADRSYTVTAVARGERGQLAAGGCQGDVSIDPDAVTREELVLNMVPLQPEGRYEVTTTWDFSRVLADSGAVGRNLSKILDIFKDPGRALYNQMLDLVETYVNSVLGKALDWFLDRTGLDTRIQNAINNAIQNNDVLCNIREAGRDLRDVVTRLHVRSELTIGKVQENRTFQGRDNWLGVTLYWRGQCQDRYQSACSGSTDRNDPSDRQKPCAAIRLTADSDGKLGSLGVVSSQWRGRVTAYNTLQIGQHPLPLRYGRLIQYVLNQVILPTLTGGQANSLTGAFAHWLGCRDLARTITGGQKKRCALGDRACIEASRLQTFCKKSIRSLFGTANLVIDALEYDTDLYIGGRAEMIEVSSDARVDYLEEGVYRGYLDVSGTPDRIIKGRSDVRGTWEGERVSTPTTTK